MWSSGNHINPVWPYVPIQPTSRGWSWSSPAPFPYPFSLPLRPPYMPLPLTVVGGPNKTPCPRPESAKQPFFRPRWRDQRQRNLVPIKQESSSQASDNTTAPLMSEERQESLVSIKQEESVQTSFKTTAASLCDGRRQSLIDIKQEVSSLASTSRAKAAFSCDTRQRNLISVKQEESKLKGSKPVISRTTKTLNIGESRDTKSFFKTENFLEADIPPSNIKIERVETAACNIELQELNELKTVKDQPSWEGHLHKTAIKREAVEGSEFLLEDSFLKSSIDEAVSIQNIQIPLLEEMSGKRDGEDDNEHLSAKAPELLRHKDRVPQRSKESKKCKLRRLFGGTDSPPRRSRDVKCKRCRFGLSVKRDASLKLRPLQEDIATCSYVMLDALADECPLGHILDPNVASINIKTGLVTIYCSVCCITIYMKNSLIPKNI